MLASSSWALILSVPFVPDVNDAVVLDPVTGVEIGKLLGLLIVPCSGRPFVPATFMELGVASVLRSTSVVTVPFSVPLGATAYAAVATAPSTVVTLAHLILNFAPAATETG